MKIQINGVTLSVEYEYQPIQKGGLETEPLSESVEVTEIQTLDNIYALLDKKTIAEIEKQILENIRNGRN